MEALGIAVVGTGFIGPVHVEAVRRLGYQVVGVVGSSPARARQHADELGIARAYDSAGEMLADPAVSVVHITTPNRTHFELARAALLAGKHVVCEKPLAMTTAESAALVKLAAERPGQVAAVNYNIRFYPLCLEARELIRSGQIGGVLSVQGSYLQDWLLYPTDWNWRLLPEEGGALRAVADIGTHWLDLVTTITGLSVDRVLADLATFIPVRHRPKTAVATFRGKESDRSPGASESASSESAPGGQAAGDDVTIATEDYASVLLRFRQPAGELGGGQSVAGRAGAPRGVLTVSQVNAGRKNRLYFEIAGTKASLAWDSERPNEIWIGHRERPNELLLRDPALVSPAVREYINYPGGHNEGFPDTFKQLYRAVYGQITTGRSGVPYPTFADGHREIVLCEAIAQSAREERWVDVPEA